jgi:hypothetical protein
MDNAFDEMRAAVARAKQVNDAVDSQVNTIVDLIDGRLRKVSPYRLRRLKAALRDFNMITGEWKG